MCVGASGLVGYNRPEILRKQQQRQKKKPKHPNQLIALENTIAANGGNCAKGGDIALNLLDLSCSYEESTMATASFMTLSPNSRA